MQQFHKILSWIANSLDPDQTAVWSESALFAYAILSETSLYEILGQLPFNLLKNIMKKGLWLHCTTAQVDLSISCMVGWS